VKVVAVAVELLQRAANVSVARQQSEADESSTQRRLAQESAEEAVLQRVVAGRRRRAMQQRVVQVERQLVVLDPQLHQRNTDRLTYDRRPRYVQGRLSP